MDIMLKDVAGELVNVLGPIARVGGNVITVIHKRDETSSKGNLPIHIVFEVDSKAQVDSIIDGYRKEKIRIVKMDEVKRFYEIMVGMIGHIVHTNLTETIRSVDFLDFCKVTDLQIDMPDIKQESCAMLRININCSMKDGRKIVMSKIRETGRKKNLMIIESV